MNNYIIELHDKNKPFLYFSDLEQIQLYFKNNGFNTAARTIETALKQFDSEPLKFKVEYFNRSLPFNKLYKFKLLLTDIGLKDYQYIEYYKRGENSIIVNRLGETFIRYNGRFSKVYIDYKLNFTTDLYISSQTLKDKIDSLIMNYYIPETEKIDIDTLLKRHFYHDYYKVITYNFF